MISEIWWNRITNPVNFRNDIVKSLANDRSVCISLPKGETMPWREDFIYEIRAAVRLTDSVRSFNVKDAPANKEPAEYLLDSFFTEEEASKYWPGRDDIVEFIAKSKGTVLNRQYLYIRNISEKDSIKWLQFVDKYMKLANEDEHCLFILETSGRELTSERVSCFDYQDYVSEYDRQLLCLAIASSLKCSNDMRWYISAVAANVVGGDIELAGMLALDGLALAKDPSATVKKLMTANGREFDQKQTRFAVWKAQMNMVFPLIEQFRQYFSEKYSGLLEAYLPINNSAGDSIRNVNDLEIGNIYYIVNSYISSIASDDNNALDLCRNARNILAHMHTLSIDELSELETQVRSVLR